MKEFIPKSYKKESIYVLIDKAKLELIDTLCIKYNVNRKDFINRCIDFAISNINNIK